MWYYSLNIFRDFTMSKDTHKSTFEFGLGIGVSHHVNRMQGGTGCFIEAQLGLDSVKEIISNERAKEVASKVFELANVEPPVLVIDDKYQEIHYNYGENGFGTAYAQPSFVTGPYNTLDLVGVSEDSDHLYARNRSDKANRA